MGALVVSGQVSESDLIEAAVAGDRLVTGRLLLSHAPGLSRFIAARLPAEIAAVASAEDVLQDTFVAAFRDIRKFEPRENGSFGGWLTTIAEHQVLSTLDRLRAQKRGGRRTHARPPSGHVSSIINLVEQLSGSGNRPSGQAAQHEAVRAVQVGLASLPKSQQDAVRIRHLDGKSIAQTAVALGRPPGAVRGLLQRARKTLRGALGRSSRWFYSK
jgi:RNA polymerase sigma-70 factor (ECF subfamily)